MSTSDTETDEPRPPGRPRDGSIDDRIVAVTREMLLDVGWEGLSLRAVAAKAGVGRASLRRRWRTKAELVLHAILGPEPDMSRFDGSDRVQWITETVNGSHELFATPEVRAAVPGLLQALRENDDLRRRLWSDFSGPPASLFAADPESTRSADPDIDARAILALAAGSALFLSAVATDDDSDVLRRRIVEILTAAL
ncbi:TetR/AcrR family transcriptional regulator [Williamsia sp. D3]|uniref:TetR/AcrR family transcriptional regulator n=1 Tax=Williamsia sp. D3 TaxID=1313067 RepID=UPI0003D2C43C|nr:TetR family transcriptional regulator [Williamsia sp. D3]ETD34456.1 TetR family transcriptional regulator [Williamsia sp. D3]